MKFFRKHSKLFLLMYVGIFCLSVAGTAFAGDKPDWMEGGDDAEEELSSSTERLFKIFLLFAAACGGLGFAWGLASVNGLWGDESKGQQKIKIGLITIAVAGAGLTIVTFFADL